MRTITFNTPDSSNIKTMTWAMPETSIGKFIEHSSGGGTLTVEFASGATYEYYDVLLVTVLDVVSAKSVGSVFNLFIRNDHRYKYIGESCEV